MSHSFTNQSGNESTAGNSLEQTSSAPQSSEFNRERFQSSAFVASQREQALEKALEQSNRENILRMIFWLVLLYLCYLVYCLRSESVILFLNSALMIVCVQHMRGCVENWAFWCWEVPTTKLYRIWPSATSPSKISHCTWFLYRFSPQRDIISG